MRACQRSGALCNLRLVLAQIVALERRRTRIAAALASPRHNVDVEGDPTPLELLHPLTHSAGTTASVSVAASLDRPQSSNCNCSAYEAEYYIRLQHMLLIYYAVDYREQEKLRRVLKEGVSSAAVEEISRFEVWKKLAEERMVEYASKFAREERWGRPRLGKVMLTLQRAFGKEED